jgi:hypothetical protein
MSWYSTDVVMHSCGHVNFELSYDLLLVKCELLKCCQNLLHTEMHVSLVNSVITEDRTEITKTKFIFSTDRSIFVFG